MIMTTMSSHAHRTTFNNCFFPSIYFLMSKSYARIVTMNQFVFPDALIRKMIKRRTTWGSKKGEGGKGMLETKTTVKAPFMQHGIIIL